MNKYWSTRVVFAGMLSSGVLVSYAQAQEIALEEIVVTSRKTNESILDIPLSVTAFNDAQLRARDLNEMGDLSSFVPGLTFFESTDRSYGQLTFRGMRNPSNFDTTRENSSVFIDGVYYIGSLNTIDFADLERVEVVKGPQSAFFGRSTFAGAVNFITKTPGNEFSGRAFGRIAEHDNYEVSGSAEIPLIEDRAALRVNGRFHTYGGEYRNAVDNSKMGDTQNLSGAATLFLNPSDNFEIRARVSYAELKDGPAATQMVRPLSEHNCGPFGGTNRNNPQPATLYCGVIDYDGAQPASTPYPTYLDGKVPFDAYGLRSDYLFASLNATYEFGNGYSLASLTGYQDEDLDRVSDFEFQVPDAFSIWLERDTDSFSQEIRLESPQDDRLRWLAGAYYFDQDYTATGRFITGPDSLFVTILGGSCCSPSTAPPSPKNVENVAGFGSISYDVLDTLTVSVEGRYQREKITNINAAGDVFAFTTKKFLPRIIVDYKPNDDLTIYFNASMGNKPTQANADVAQLTDAGRQVAAAENLFLVAPEEVIWNYEIGIKSSFWGGRGNFTAAAFYADWKDKQGVSTVFVDINQNGILETNLVGAEREIFNGVVIPAGDEKVTGLEMDVNALITDNLTIGGSFAWNNPDFTNLDDALYERYYGQPDASRQDEGGVAEYSATTYVEYRDMLNSDMEWFARADAILVGSEWASILNTAETGTAFDMNLRAGIVTDTYTVTFFVDNALNDNTYESLRSNGDSVTDGFRFGTRAYEVGLPRGRQFGVTAGVNF